MSIIVKVVGVIQGEITCLVLRTRDVINCFHKLDTARLFGTYLVVLAKPYQWTPLTALVIFNVGLTTLLHQGLSEPEFYGDLVYKFKKKIVGRADFSDQFKKIIVRYKRIGYNINIM